MLDLLDSSSFPVLSQDGSCDYERGSNTFCLGEVRLQIQSLFPESFMISVECMA